MYFTSMKLHPEAHSDTTAYTGTSCTESDICFRTDIISSKQTWNPLTTQWPVVSIGLKGKWTNHLTNEHTVVSLRPCCSAADRAPFRLCSLPLTACGQLIRGTDMLVKYQKKDANYPGPFYFLLYFNKSIGCMKIVQQLQSFCSSYYTNVYLLTLQVMGVMGVFKSIVETCLMVYSKLALLQLHSFPDD